MSLSGIPSMRPEWNLGTQAITDNNDISLSPHLHSSSPLGHYRSYTPPKETGFAIWVHDVAASNKQIMELEINRPSSWGLQDRGIKKL
ncbi:hypothetical protein PC9H_011152 [Pleurotus ostreatus]|uniref:Uncharacterized protein n=1 Tax=Pleurotus ostreatus TaxID=5322 RepID=A0A8H6ZQ23_PLEOS|nr:uncharacterized protein PC9H_011152 [Pleurotus ostreatus]KAF7422988.1 hypothetical protein PC9H_011152 [Pleurotus ostreatus]KAJ8691016.1 hypothetical protein PTI98_010630 [Pleurotus ostreatus]